MSVAFHEQRIWQPPRRGRARGGGERQAVLAAPAGAVAEDEDFPGSTHSGSGDWDIGV